MYYFKAVVSFNGLPFSLKDKIKTIAGEARHDPLSERVFGSKSLLPSSVALSGRSPQQRSGDRRLLRRPVLAEKTGAPRVFEASADWLKPFASREIVSQLELEENKSRLCLSVRDFGPVSVRFGAFAILGQFDYKTPLVCVASLNDRRQCNVVTVAPFIKL